ncbi:MAG: GNAT family N-acetyltransferase [Bacillota bacterium]|nr:GNAT family N-acetyltransferase [Bacillota bacterium]
MTVRLRPATPEDADGFAPLLLLSAEEFLPAVFGPSTAPLLTRLFREAGNLFSFRHVRFAEAGGRLLGLTLAYSADEERRERLRTGWLLMLGLGGGFLARLGPLLSAQGLVAAVRPGEHYLSNIAVSPAARGQGVGSLLLAALEQEARAAGSRALVLDVETANHGAIRLYRRHGFVVERTTAPRRLGPQSFRFHRMRKELR